MPRPAPRDETHALRGILSGEVPVVVDAGALDLVAGAAAPLVVTPHDREHTRLREALGLGAAPGPEADSTRAPRPRSRRRRRSVRACWSRAARRSSPRPRDRSASSTRERPGSRRPARATCWAGSSAPSSPRRRRSGGRMPSPSPTSRPPARGSTAGRPASPRQRLGSAGGPITALDVAEALPYAVAEVLAAD